MPNTIAAFYTFTANTTARSGQMNENFSNMRGDLIPIDPTSTGASADNTYDIGTSDYRWAQTFSKEIDIKGATTTSNLTIRGSDEHTAGGVYFQFGGTTQFQFEPESRLRTTLIDTNIGNTGTLTDIAGSTVTIQTYGNRKVLLRIQSANTTASRGVHVDGVNGSLTVTANFRCIRNGSQEVGQFHISKFFLMQSDTSTSAQTYGSLVINWAWFDDSAPSGTLTHYHIRYRNANHPNSIGVVYFKAVLFSAEELL